MIGGRRSAGGMAETEGHDPLLPHARRRERRAAWHQGWRSSGQWPAGEEAKTEQAAKGEQRENRGKGSRGFWSFWPLSAFYFFLFLFWIITTSHHN